MYLSDVIPVFFSFSFFVFVVKRLYLSIREVRHFYSRYLTSILLVQTTQISFFIYVLILGYFSLDGLDFFLVYLIIYLLSFWFEIFKQPTQIVF